MSPHLDDRPALGANGYGDSVVGGAFGPALVAGGDSPTQVWLFLLPLIGAVLAFVVVRAISVPPLPPAASGGHRKRRDRM